MYFPLQPPSGLNERILHVASCMAASLVMWGLPTLLYLHVWNHDNGGVVYVVALVPCTCDQWDSGSDE